MSPGDSENFQKKRVQIESATPVNPHLIIRFQMPAIIGCRRTAHLEASGKACFDVRLGGRRPC